MNWVEEQLNETKGADNETSYSHERKRRTAFGKTKPSEMNPHVKIFGKKKGEKNLLLQFTFTLVHW